MRLTVSLLATLCLTATLAAKDYWVSAINGNDSNPGTRAAPFKTIGRAISLATTNDRVMLLPGRYTPTGGESFPISIPDGVSLIGTNARECVIDAEFDPQSANNPVTGNLVNVGSNCRLAHVSIVNAARDPANPGNHWWKIAVLVQDSTGNAKNVEIDHVILDNVSRGIVAGYATGNHDVQNVQIHNCLIQRMYVEGVNSWAGDTGTASGNMLYNCTFSSHINTSRTPPVPAARALVSFGKNSQFDVRNSVFVQGDWAGIEADPTAKITSNYNAVWNAPYRGVTAGANDLNVDPMLPMLPTMSDMMDPHQISAATSPLWQKGTTLAGQHGQTDIDYLQPRVVGGIVDIGVDEWFGFDMYFIDPVQVGKTTRIATVGTPQTQALIALGFRSLSTGVSIPGIGGTLWLDPSVPIIIGLLPKDNRGWGVGPLLIPSDPSLAGITLYLQGIDTPTLTFSDLDRVTLIN